MFSLFKGFPALPAPIIAPIHEKKQRAQVDGDGTYKSTSLAVMFTDDRCLRPKGYWEDNPHVKCCVLCKMLQQFKLTDILH